MKRYHRPVAHEANATKVVGVLVVTSVWMSSAAIGLAQVSRRAPSPDARLGPQPIFGTVPQEGSVTVTVFDQGAPVDDFVLITEPESGLVVGVVAHPTAPYAVGTAEGIAAAYEHLQVLDGAEVITILSSPSVSDPDETLPSPASLTRGHMDHWASVMLPRAEFDAVTVFSSATQDSGRLLLFWGAGDLLAARIYFDWRSMEVRADDDHYFHLPPLGYKYFCKDTWLFDPIHERHETYFPIVKVSNTIEIGARFITDANGRLDCVQVPILSCKF